MNNIIWTVNSNYALVTCYKKNYKLWVEKKIAPKVANAENAAWINNTTESFRAELLKCRVPLAEPYIYNIEGDVVTHTCPFVGQDIEKYIEGKCKNIQVGVLAEVLRAIKGVLEQTKPIVGIDARLSNFCIGKDGVVYVDTFPPLVVYNDELLVHFPNPTDTSILDQEFKRKFTAFGILRRLRFSILEQDSFLQENDLIEAIRLVMGEDFANEIQRFFGGFLDKVSLSEAVGRITLNDPDGIREVAIAIKYVWSDEKRKQNLIEIFNLSSNYCPYNLTPEERLRRIKELLVT